MVNADAEGAKPRKKKPEPKPKMTNEEQHKLFVETAREVGASESSDEFDRAFSSIINGSLKKKTN
jgi:hypothetical protein